MQVSKGGINYAPSASLAMPCFRSATAALANWKRWWSLPKDDKHSLWSNLHNGGLTNGKVGGFHGRFEVIKWKMGVNIHQDFRRVGPCSCQLVRECRHQEVEHFTP